MKSMDEVQRMKVAELKQELVARGLDTKGIKATLVDRLLDAMLSESDEVGNWRLVRPTTLPKIGALGSGEEECVQEGESMRKATRGHSQSPVRVKPASSPTKMQTGVDLPAVAVPSSPLITVPQMSTVKTPVSLSNADTPSDVVTLSSDLAATPSTKVGSPINSTAISTSPTKLPPTLPTVFSASLVKAEEPITVNEADSSAAEKAGDDVIEPVEISSTTTTELESIEENDAITQSCKPSHPEGNDNVEGSDVAEDCGGTEEFVEDAEGGDSEEKMETANSETLKRKHEEEERCDVQDRQVKLKTCEEPKKIRLDHYSGKILPEDEPAFDEKEVLLDWYNSDLNIGISKENFLKATPIVFDEFPWAYSGVKATYGFKKGKLAFEVMWLDNIAVRTDFGEVEEKHVLRIGWTDLYADLQLGEDKFSFGFDSQGKLFNGGNAEDLEGSAFERGDVISTFLDLESDPVEMKFSKNGKDVGNSIKIPKAELEGKVLFPHVLSRNVVFEVNFGSTEPVHAIPEEFVMVAKLDEESRIRGPIAPREKADCEFVMLVGMAGCGKTKWAKDHKSRNLDKHFNIIGTSSVVERAVKKSTLSGDKVPRSYDSFLMKAGRYVEKLVDLAPTRRRNYILDQSNVLPVVQRRKAAGFEGFKRRAVVILPNDEEYLSRIKAREQEQGKSVPKSTLLDMKATFRLPEVGEIFSEVEFPELSEAECKELLKKYNKEGADAGYYGQKPSRGGWYGPGGFRGGRGFRGGFRGPRRGSSGFRGGLPFRFLRGDFRPPRGGPARISRDFSSPRFSAPRGGRGGPPPLLIPRRNEPPRSAWIRGVPPISARGASSAPRMFTNPLRQSYGGSGGRSGYGNPPMGNPRQLQSVWTSGQPGGGWGHGGRGVGFHYPQQQQNQDPWIQQVPDQGYGQRWGDGGRGGGGGTWQGYSGQTYGNYRK